MSPPRPERRFDEALLWGPAVPGGMPASDPVLEGAPATPNAGLIGVGAIGGGVARCLLRQHVPLRLWNRSRSRAEPLVAAGAQWAEHPKALAAALGPGGVLFTALPEARDVGRVLFGRRGAVAGASRGLLVVNLSTVAPDQSRDLAARLAERGVGLLDVPVGGSADAAESGELILYVGGEDRDFDRALPLLRTFSRRIERMGPVGAGSAMKLANNLLTVGILEMSAEAIELGSALGLDRARVVEVLLAGGARSVMLERKREPLLRHEYPPAFRLALARKDLKLIERAGHEVHQPLPVTHAARRVFDRAMNEGRGDLDFAAVAETVRGLRTEARTRGPGGPPDPLAGSTGEGTG